MLNEALDARNEVLNSLHYLDTTDQAVQHLVQDMEVYINVIEEPVTTEELLEDSEIVDMLQADDMIENDILNLDEENEELPPPPISVMEASNALKILITFYEQTETIFSNDEVKMLRKKVPIFEVMKIEAKKQTSLDVWRV